MFHLSEHGLFLPHTLIPVLNHLRVTGQSTVLVFDGTVAQVKHSVALLLLGWRKHITFGLRKHILCEIPA